MKQTWLITGSSRGLGLEIARAALAAGCNVVAGARKPEAVTAALGAMSDTLLPVALDVTRQDQAKAAVEAATARFGGIDVVVNNAGYGQLGYFEENTADDARAQMETNLLGTMIVSWAVLPVMRKARKGRIFNISSLAGIRGSEMGSIYCASKFAVEGFSEALAAEVERFGIKVTIVEPGFFRTGFLEDNSLRFGGAEVADYAEQSQEKQALYRGLSGQQPGDPAKLAAALIRLAAEENPPIRFAAGSDCVAAIEDKLTAMRADLDRWRSLSVDMESDA